MLLIRRRFSRAFQAGLLGALLGMVLISTEAVFALSLGGLEFEGPLAHLLDMEKVAAFMVGSLCFVVGFLFAWSPRKIVAIVGGLTVFWMLHIYGSYVWFSGSWPLRLGVDGIGILLGFSLFCWFQRSLANPRQAWRFMGGLWLLCHGFVAFFVPDASSVMDADHLPHNTPGARKPNVVIVLIDTLRADHLGVYGYERPTSPNLDAIAAQGVIFENAWAQAPWTRPSVASLMTGLFPSSHNTTTVWKSIPKSLPMVSTMMKSQGYHTAAFSANMQVSPVFGFGRGFDLFWTVEPMNLRRHLSLGRTFIAIRKRMNIGRLAAEFARFGKEETSQSGEEDKVAHNVLMGTDAASVTDEVEDWMDEMTEDVPYFLYVHYVDPHDPYEPPVDELNKKNYDIKALHEVIKIPIQPEPYPNFQAPKPSADALQGLLDLYDAEILFTDKQMGRLISGLESRGLLTQDDYLIVTADHGEEFYDHGQWHHGNSLFQELLHVPLLIRGPGIGPRRVVMPAQLIDVFPTLASLLGAPLLDGVVQGMDLSDLLHGGVDHPNRTVFAERPDPDWFLYAARKNDGKLIWQRGNASEVWLEYQLGQDPGEQMNLAGKSGSSAGGVDLEDILREFPELAAKLSRGSSGNVEMDAATLAQLRALGYIE